MEPVILSWTPTNWVTVFLMAVGGALIVSLAVMGFRYVTTQSTTTGA